MPESVLRVGLIGTGHVARAAHLPAWNARPGAAVTALCDIDPAALAAASRAARGAECFAGHRELLASSVDAVSVCASSAAHFPIVRDALEAGKHVLCEKPLALSGAEVTTLGGLAEALGLVLMTQHQLRFGGPARAAMECVRAGRVGKIHHARVRALRRDRVPTLPGFTDWELAGGGAVLDLGIHALDIALWLMDFPKPARVSGAVRVNFAHGDRIAGHWGDWDRARFSVEDFGAGFVHFEDGSTLALECAWLGHHADEGLGCTLFGEAGTLSWPSGELVVQGAGGLRRESAPSGDEDPADLHAAAIAAFHAAVTAGGPSPVPWRETRDAIAIVEALYRSAREGAEVRLA